MSSSALSGACLRSASYWGSVGESCNFRLQGRGIVFQALDRALCDIRRAVIGGQRGFNARLDRGLALLGGFELVFQRIYAGDAHGCVFLWDEWVLQCEADFSGRGHGRYLDLLTREVKNLVAVGGIGQR